MTRSQLLVGSGDKAAIVHLVLQGWTALHSAACDDDRESIELLLSYGADKTAETTEVSRVQTCNCPLDNFDMIV